MKKIKAATIQSPPIFLNIDETIEKSIALIDQCLKNDANIIAFPETWFPGYPVWLDSAPNSALWDYKPSKELYALLINNSLTKDDSRLDIFSNIASENKIAIIMGLHERNGSSLFNSIFFFSDNGELQIHRKLVPTHSERLIWQPGRDELFGKSRLGDYNIGGLVCWEHWMPLARMASHQNHELLHICQWPSVHDKHLIASLNYAFEGATYVIASGCILSKKDILAGAKSVGISDEALELLSSIQINDNNLALNGLSKIISPEMTIIADGKDSEEIIYAEIDPQIQIERKSLLDINGHYSRPDIFRFSYDH